MTAPPPRPTLASFQDEAARVVRERVDRLRALGFAGASSLPRASGEDIVVAGKEVQLTTFRQADLESMQGQVLVTIQLARFGLGGVTSFRMEKGLVFSADAPPREATEEELRMTGS